MKYTDFVIRYDPTKDTKEDLTKRILYSLFINRIRSKKPVVTFVGGDSGEGKSYFVLKLQEVLLGFKELELKEFINDVNVYVPIEYPKKIEPLLHDKRLRKVNILAMHEAREVIKAKMWHSFLTQSVADINAMSRTVKRLMIFIISQFIRDIAVDIRYTITYYITVTRSGRANTKAKIYKMWKDDRDLQNPKIRKRRISGYLIMPNGKYKRYTPEYLQVTKPSKEVQLLFEEQDYKAKSSIIKRKLNKLIKEMEMEVTTEDVKTNLMIDYYTKNLENLRYIGKQVRKKFKVKKDMKDMHGLTDYEFTLFEDKLNEKLKSMHLLGEPENATE